MVIGIHVGNLDYYDSYGNLSYRDTAVGIIMVDFTMGTINPSISMMKPIIVVKLSYMISDDRNYYDVILLDYRDSTVS